MNNFMAQTLLVYLRVPFYLNTDVDESQTLLSLQTLQGFEGLIKLINPQKALIILYNGCMTQFCQLRSSFPLSLVSLHCTVIIQHWFNSKVIGIL